MRRPKKTLPSEDMAVRIPKISQMVPRLLSSSAALQTKAFAMTKISVLEAIAVSADRADCHPLGFDTGIQHVQLQQGLEEDLRDGRLPDRLLSDWIPRNQGDHILPQLCRACQSHLRPTSIIPA